MKKLILSIGFCAALSACAQTYTEFYITGTGANTNAGSTVDNGPTFAVQSGNWIQASGIFWKAAMTPAASGVTNGAWAAIYPDGNEIPAFIGVVTNADDTTNSIRLSLVAKAGTAPGDSTGGMSICVGGAWKGPGTYSTASGSILTNTFPLSFVNGSMTNGSFLTPRINILSNSVYVATNQVTIAAIGPMIFQGYGATLADGTMAIIGGSTAGASHVLLSITGTELEFYDLKFMSNGLTGSAQDLVNCTGAGSKFRRCVFNHARKNGLSAAALAVECEAYNCNENNNVNQAGFFGIGAAIRCLSYSNTTANAQGFVFTGGGVGFGCIAAFNGHSGFSSQPAASRSDVLVNCDSYSNSFHGVELYANVASGIYMENCNLLKNGQAGFTNSAGAGTLTPRSGLVVNCWAGQGTMTNYGGNFWPVPGVTFVNTNIYATDETPYNAANSGDFRIVLAAARAAGRGAFTQTSSGWTGTVGYPDIGAAQSVTNAVGGGGGGSWSFAQ